METTISKSRIIVGLLTALFRFNATCKHTNPQMMEHLKLDDWRIIIAIGELVSTALFLFPKTSKWGVILLSAYMGGAIVAHMISVQPIYMPSAVLILIWVTGFIRNPALFKLNYNQLYGTNESGNRLIQRFTLLDFLLKKIQKVLMNNLICNIRYS